MLISFSIENWMSFRDKTTLSMIASSERQHGERIPKLKKYRARILPIAAIYGGNASGKTNLFKALEFAQTLVVDGVRPEEPIPVKTFRLDPKAAKKPLRFSFEILLEGTIYDFSFALTRKTIVEERLTKITSASEKVLYDRHKSQLNFDESLADDSFLQFAFQGTQDNQLFLTNSISQKVENFKPLYNWFRYQLVLISPDAHFELFNRFLDEEDPLYASMNEALRRLDTGITRLGGEKISLKNASWPEELKTTLEEKVKEGTLTRVTQGQSNSFVVTREDGELVAKKLVTFHSKPDGSEVRFDAIEESDGSQRIMDLLPAFLDLASKKSERVYVIDEVDRSLHALLIRQLIEKYLSSCSSKTRSQLLVTTHNTLLMDQRLLRRDETWITERDTFGVSKLLSFSEFKDVRYDKDVRKSYLQGRLGGVPRILLDGILNGPSLVKENEGHN